MGNFMKKREYLELEGFEGLTLQEATFAVEYVKDFMVGAAAERTGITSRQAEKMFNDIRVQEVIRNQLQLRNEMSQIDAEWVMWEAVDNHRIARQSGNLNASNKALEMIGKMATVDAFAAEKVKVTVDEGVLERLNRGRQRARMREEAVDAEVIDVVATTTSLPRPTFL